MGTEYGTTTGGATIADLRALEAALAPLEALVNRFNIFEAVGLRRQEIRHSAFLAFLLDPKGSHGLGDTFVRSFIETVLAEDPLDDSHPGGSDVGAWQFQAVTVRRERDNIDILLVDAQHSLAVIVENKIGSGEHGDQLKRYWKLIRSEYPHWSVRGVFLTPDGATPSNRHYIAFDYGRIINLVNAAVATTGLNLLSDVRTLIQHYFQMLGRHVMPESDVAKLARRIYDRHQLAIELILEHRPDRWKDIVRVVERLVKDAPGLKVDSAPANMVRIRVEDWSSTGLRLGTGTGWGGSLLLFEFKYEGNAVHFYLYMGPGPVEVRQPLFEHARAEPFNLGGPYPEKGYVEFWHEPVVDPESLQELDSATADLENFWDRFTTADLPRIKASIRDAKFLWPGC